MQPHLVKIAKSNIKKNILLLITVAVLVALVSIISPFLVAIKKPCLFGLK